MKNILIGVGVALVVGFALGFLVFHQSSVVGAVQPNAGVTNTSAKLASITFQPATATSTFLYNGDSTDRGVTDEFAYCSGVGYSYTAYTGAGLASLTLQAATSSSNSISVANSNINYVFNGLIATSSAVASTTYAASSTLPVLGSLGMVWTTGTYLRLFTNATNTANCTIGVHYLSL